MQENTYPRVLTHIAGSKVVVELGHDEYIDARKDVRTPNFSHIEYVRGGRVKYRLSLHDIHAPKMICQWMRREFV